MNNQPLTEALSALLNLNSPACQPVQTSPNAVTFQVFTHKTRRGVLILPLIFQLELELTVTLDESRRTFSFSGKVFEQTRFTMKTETFKGIYRSKAWGKFVTYDGVVSVKYDTGALFDQVEATLNSLGWSRG